MLKKIIIMEYLQLNVGCLNAERGPLTVGAKHSSCGGGTGGLRILLLFLSIISFHLSCAAYVLVLSYQCLLSSFGTICL
jgi:hypothetical protein